MPKVFDVQTNTEVDVPDSSAAVAGINSGRYKAIPGETYVAKVDGRARSLSGEEVTAAVPHGIVSPQNLDASFAEVARKVKREEATSPGARISGAVFKALDTATLGGLSTFAKATGGNLEPVREFEKHNPLLAGGASLAGAFLPGTPASALFRLGSKASKGLGAISGGAVAGGIEGVGFGAGQVLSDMAIHDVPFSASVLLETAGAGAVLGGAAGGLLKVGKKLASKGDDFAGPLDLSSPAAKELRTGLDDSFASVNSIHKKFDDDAIHGLQSVDEDLVTLYKESFGTLANKAGAVFDDLSGLSRTTKALQKLDDAVEDLATAKNTVKAQRRVRDAWAKVQETTADVPTVINRARPKGTEVAKESQEAVQLAWTMVKNLAKLDVVTTAPKVGKSLKVAADKSRTALQKVLGGKGLNASVLVNAIKTVNPKDPSKLIEVAEKYKTYLDDLAKLRDVYLDSGNVALIARGNQLGQELGDVGAKMSSAVSRAFPEGFDKSGILSAAGVYIGGDVVIPELGGPADDILKLGLAALMLRKPAGAKARKGIAKAVETFGMSTGTRGFGRAGQNIAGARQKFQGSAGDILDAGAFAVGGMVGRGLAGAMLGRTQTALTGMQRKLGKVFRAGGKLGRKMAPVTAANIYAKTSFGIVDKKDEPDNFKRLQKEISFLASDPEALDRAITEGLAPIAQHSLKLADEAWLQRRTQILHAAQTMPKDPGTVMALGKSKWQQPASEQRKWANTLIGTFYPSQVIDHMTAGRVTPEMAQAFRINHPAYFLRMQEYFVEHLEEIQENSKLAQRIAIGLMFGIPTDPTMQMGMMLQDNFLDVEVQQTQQTPPGSGGANLQTRAQELTT